MILNVRSSNDEGFSEEVINCAKKGISYASMYTTVLILRSMIYSAVGKGCDLQSLCEATDLTPADLHDAEKRVEGVDPCCRLWEAILAQTKDEAIGLHLGIEHNLAGIGLIGYVIHNCPTLKEAWQVFQDNQRLLSGWVSYEMQFNKDNVQLVYTVDPVWVKASPHTASQAAELPMASLLGSLRTLSGKNIYPTLVEVVRPKPSTAEEYEKIFKCAIKFSAPANRLTFHKDMPSTPVLSADRSLYATFSQLLSLKTAELATSTTFAEEVKGVLMSDFKSVVPAIEVIASHMNMSSRSFQRKLEAEGSSYRAISEEIKKELTLALLKNPKYNSNEISRALGYAEPAAFRLAFKRWMDETPAQWRKGNMVKTV
jgi:AraC-like DNA-binding protein